MKKRGLNKELYAKTLSVAGGIESGGKKKISRDGGVELFPGTGRKCGGPSKEERKKAIKVS